MAKAPESVSKELVSLVKLVSFFKQLRHKDDLDKAAFFFVNDLFNIVPYRQCVFWTYLHGKVNVQAASGQVDVGNQTPHAQLLKKAVKNLIDKKAIKNSDVAEHVEKHGFSSVCVVSPDDLAGISTDVLNEWFSPHTICVFLYDHSTLIGGVWLERDNALGEMEMAVLDDACDAMSTRAQFYKKKMSGGLKSIFYGRKVKLVLLLLALIFCLWPVRFSITSSAEIVPQNMDVVTVRFNSLIAEVLVKPNQFVKAGDVLFSLEKTQLENEYALAIQKLETARARLSKTQREVFADATKNSEINVLTEDIKSKLLDVDYAKERLGLSDVRAPKEGIILFSDVNDLVGQPVKTGDKVMVLADPDQIELLVRLPADSMIELDNDVPLKLFLNTEPLKSYQAQIHTVSYQPTRDADGTLSYKARAKLNMAQAPKRIGLTGTAKVYGSRTIMILNILRRPFIALRNISSF